MRYAVISSTPDLLYAEFLPITTLFWQRLDYQAICLLTDEARWRSPAGKLILKTLRELTPHVYFLSAVPSKKSSTVAQTARLATAALDFEPDDYLLTADVDMFPFSSEWFHRQDPEASFHVFGADAYYPPLPRFPICYLSGTRQAWKSMMGIGEHGLQSELEKLLHGEPDDWNTDEMLAGKKLIGWSKFKSCQLIDRGWHGFADRRLDRGYWDLNVNLDALIDCHSVRPLLTNWDSIVKLVEHFLSARAESIVHQYVTKLKEACSIPTT